MFLSHIFVCFPHMLKWASNVFSLSKIDVIPYPYHHYSSHIDETTFGLKSVVGVPFWFFSSWITPKGDHFSLYAKPLHIWHKTKPFYPKRVRLCARSRSTTSGWVSMTLTKWRIFGIFSLFGAFWFSNLNQTPQEFVCLPKIFFWTTNLHKLLQKKF